MSLGEIGENQGSWEETGNAPMIILRYMGSGMYERCDLELGMEDGFIQEGEAAKESFIPEFNLEGIGI